MQNTSRNNKTICILIFLTEKAFGKNRLALEVDPDSFVNFAINIEGANCYSASIEIPVDLNKQQ